MLLSLLRLVWLCAMLNVDNTLLARQKARADAEFYMAKKISESNKVRWWWCSIVLRFNLILSWSFSWATWVLPALTVVREDLGSLPSLLKLPEKLSDLNQNLLRLKSKPAQMWVIPVRVYAVSGLWVGIFGVPFPRWSGALSSTGSAWVTASAAAGALALHAWNILCVQEARVRRCLPSWVRVRSVIAYPNWVIFSSNPVADREVRF